MVEKMMILKIMKCRRKQHTPHDTRSGSKKRKELAGFQGI